MSSRLLITSVLVVVFLFASQANAIEREFNLIYAGQMPLIDNRQDGDYPELAGLLAETRKSSLPTFFFFGGGSLGPSPMSGFDRGSHIIDILNTLEPDVMAITKREFSYFEDELSLRSYEATFPFIASNLQLTEGKGDLDGLIKKGIIEKAGIKVGVLSVLDPLVVKEYLLTKVEITEPKLALLEQSKQLRKLGADVIVLLYSVNLPFISEFLTDSVIDLALLTDHNFSLSNIGSVPDHPNSIYLTTPGAVADIRLKWNKGKRPLEVSWQAKQLAQIEPEPLVKEQVANYSLRLERLLDEEIGTLLTPMNTSRKIVRTEESEFGNFVADSLKEFTKADLALINGGIIRGALEYEANTKLTRRDIAKELPFRSRVVVIETTGKVLKAAAENGLSMVESNKGRFLHYSGAKLVYDTSKEPGQRLTSLEINGHMVNDRKLYKVATSDYIFNGGDDFTMFKTASPIELSTQVAPLISEIVINRIRQFRSIIPLKEGRLVNLAKEKQ